MNDLEAIDLFCGAGGLTVGLKDAGFDVIGAVDINSLAVSTYEMNHVDGLPKEDRVEVWESTVQREGLIRELMDRLEIEPGELDLLAGCPPCEGFSTLRTMNGKYSYKEDEEKNDLVYQFLRYVKQLLPKAIMMENVPGLADDDRMETVLYELDQIGYDTNSGEGALKVLDAADYGVPQRRKRMILMTGRGFPIQFAPEDDERKTVDEAIGHLKAPSEGTPKDKQDDPLHYHGERRSDEVKKIMSMIPEGKSRKDLPKKYWLECQKECSGFKDVYGRMDRNEVAPTITGGCIKPSKGRFIHPSMDQNRAITLRESALLQSFPENYKISLDRGKHQAAKLIGDALPPRFIAKHATMAYEAIKRQDRGH